MTHILLQRLAPQHALSRFAGWVSTCRNRTLKNWILRRFIKKYHVDLTQAQLENIDDYPTFNAFFTRQLKPALRPIANASNQIASPADGTVSQIGYIQENTLLQAKGFDYDLPTLVGNPQEAQKFINGAFATLYLSPKDYHRVHMPFPGKLRQTIYIPGQLFSVNKQTTHAIPNLFTRNERLVCIFDTAIGPMAVILVGAMLVGSIETVWDSHIATGNLTQRTYDNGIELTHGAELGLFKMGSTVILLFGKDKVTWSEELKEDATLRMGQLIATI